ncbi:MAG: autotransporter assembly complex protein TamA, partial [Marinobacter sp.]
MEGDHPDLLQNARAFVGEVEGRSRASLRRYGRTAEDQVREALRALGYYEPTITRSIQDGDPPVLVLEVAPGKPVRIVSRDVEISGPAADDPEFSSNLPPQPAEGDVLNHGHYETLRQVISNRASRLGYFDGHFEERRLSVDPQAREAKIQLHYDSGERYRFGEVTFNEDHVFDNSLLERFVEIDPGTPYHADRIAELNSDLSDSGYFSSVLVTAPPSEAEDGTIPVSAKVAERDARSVAAGVGFSTDVGPRFRGNWTEHWVNAWGHRRGAETELSVPRQNITGWYELPLDPPMTDSIRLAAGYQREDIEDVQSDRLTLGQQWRHQTDSGWNRVLSMRWENERFDIGRSDSGTTRMLLPGIGFSKRHADSAMDPSRGYRLEFEVTGGLREAFSTVDVLHVNAKTSGLITLADKHRFLSRLRVGGVATNRFSDVPPSLRFFAGGDQSVRGYGYETLSPEDEDGNKVGGRYRLVGSV